MTHGISIIIRTNANNSSLLYVPKEMIMRSRVVVEEVYVNLVIILLFDPTAINEGILEVSIRHSVSIYAQRFIDV